MNKLHKGAQFLHDLRRSPRVVEGMPAELKPVSLDEAYGMQAELVDKLLAEKGGEALGYKVACTNRSAQELLEVDGPFYGCLLSPTTYPSPASLKSADFTVRAIEAEFLLEMAYDVPSREVPYTLDEIARFVGGVMPAIEIADWRYAAFGPAGGLAILADNAIHGAIVKGEGVTGAWTAADFENRPVKLYVNGALKEEGGSQNVMGSPLNVLVFLVQELATQGRQLKAGDLITTGVTTDIYLAQAGDVLTADFGTFGKVTLTLI